MIFASLQLWSAPISCSKHVLHLSLEERPSMVRDIWEMLPLSPLYASSYLVKCGETLDERV